MLGIPYVAIAIAIVVGIGAYYLRTYRSGRELYAIGSNPDAARLAGIPVGKRIFAAFVVSGALAGIAGVLWAAQYNTINSTAGTGYELSGGAAVVVGGVAIFGGSGTAGRGHRGPAAQHDHPRRSRPSGADSGGAPSWRASSSSRSCWTGSRRSPRTQARRGEGRGHGGWPAQALPAKPPAVPVLPEPWWRRLLLDPRGPPWSHCWWR